MTALADLPAWAALLTALLLVAGAGFTLLGSLGLLRLHSFYDRVHAPTLGSSLGMVCVLAASMLFFTVLDSRPIIHELLILLFVTVTMPVSLMLLANAALFRDQSEGNGAAPGPEPPA